MVKALAGGRLNLSNLAYNMHSKFHVTFTSFKVYLIVRNFELWLENFGFYSHSLLGYDPVHLRLDTRCLLGSYCFERRDIQAGCFDELANTSGYIACASA